MIGGLSDCNCTHLHSRRVNGKRQTPPQTQMQPGNHGCRYYSWIRSQTHSHTQTRPIPIPRPCGIMTRRHLRRGDGDGDGSAPVNCSLSAAKVKCSWWWVLLRDLCKLVASPHLRFHISTSPAPLDSWLAAKTPPFVVSSSSRPRTSRVTFAAPAIATATASWMLVLHHIH